jgi:hypothetical protein
MNNLSYEERKLALIEEITAAFDGVSREEGVTLHETRVIDDGGSAAERKRARKLDKEERWQDVPEKDLLRDGVLNFLDLKGFRYYVPAYIICHLRHADFRTRTNEDIVLGLNAALTDTTLSDFRLTRFKIFTYEQSRAIAHFLVFEAEQEAAELAKWKQRQPKIPDQNHTLEDYGWDGDLDDEMACAFLAPSRHDHAQWALDSYWGQYL